MATRHPGIPRTAFALGLLAAALPAAADLKWPGCADAEESQFRYQAMVGRAPSHSPKLVDPTMEEPIHMAFDSRGPQTTDIYWVERKGTVKRYDAERNRMVLLGDVGAEKSVNARDEQGLTGIALDPGFKSNRRMYLFYSPKAEANVFRVSRFSLDEDFTRIDVASEKVLIRIPSQRVTCCHTAGAMAFDLHGDLWIAVGKNSPDHPRSIDEANVNNSAEGTAANAADYRGGILRIHPDESAKGYSIPPGNYGEHWAAWFRAKGDEATAREYADPAKVLPEIYVKGTRNPYSLTVDPERRWVAWGEFGPNFTATMTEEHNLATRPMFGGYPYFAGGGGTGGEGCTYDRDFCELWKTVSSSAGIKTLDAPVNNSKWNKGPRLLPPVQAALHTYPRSGAVTGPIYRYAGESPSTIKFPPHFDKAWLVGDHRRKGLTIFKLNEQGDRITDTDTLFTRYPFADVLDIQQGSDGAIYILNYAGNRSATSDTHIGRIEYTGSCRPAQPEYPKKPSVALRGGVGPGGLVRILDGALRVRGEGPHRVQITDAGGRIVRALVSAGPRDYLLSDLAAGSRGLLFARVTDTRGSAAHAFVHLPD